MPYKRRNPYSTYVARKRRRMPAKKYRMRYRGRYRRRRQRIPRYITPDTKLVKLRYAFTTQIDPASGATAWLPIAANDLYSPSTGLGAHRPLGFDQCMQLYERFCVVGSKINVVIQSVASANHAHLHIMGVALRDTTTAENVQDNGATLANEGLLERNNTFWKYVGDTEQGAPPKTITYKFSTKKHFRVKSINDQAGSLLDEGTLWGTASASPTTKAYYNVFASTVADNADTKYFFRVVVDYVAVLSGRKMLGQS